MDRINELNKILNESTIKIGSKLTPKDMENVFNALSGVKSAKIWDNGKTIRVKPKEFEKATGIDPNDFWNAYRKSNISVNKWQFTPEEANIRGEYKVTSCKISKG